jgi:excisionase family DNA binding protein
MAEILMTTLSREDLEGLVIDCLRSFHKYHEPSAAPAAPPPARILNLNEAAALVGLAKATVYKLTSAGTIPHAKRGKKLVFEREALEAWLLENRVMPNEAEHRAADTLAASVANRRRG